MKLPPYSKDSVARDCLLCQHFGWPKQHPTSSQAASLHAQVPSTAPSSSRQAKSSRQVPSTVAVRNASCKILYSTFQLWFHLCSHLGQHLQTVMWGTSILTFLYEISISRWQYRKYNNYLCGIWSGEFTCGAGRTNLLLFLVNSDTPLICNIAEGKSDSFFFFRRCLSFFCSDSSFSLNKTNKQYYDQHICNVHWILES